MNYFETKFIKTSTAGNRTLYLIGENSYKNSNEILKNLNEKKNIEAEQIGFLWRKNNSCIMNMAGGELCGGAILGSPIVLGLTSNKTEVITMSKSLKTKVTNKDKVKYM